MSEYTKNNEELGRWALEAKNRGISYGQLQTLETTGKITKKDIKAKPVKPYMPKTENKLKKARRVLNKELKNRLAMDILEGVKTSKEIIEDYGISERTYYKYKSMVDSGKFDFGS